MTEIKGTNVASSIVPFTTEDTFATHEAKYGKGGWREVDSIAERDAISAQRREAGMAVYVRETGKVYILNPNLTTWSLFETGQVDDVRVNGESVVENKIANVSVPTKVSQLENDNNYQDSLEVAAAINQHNVDPEAHQDIRDSIVAATEFTAGTIVPTTTNFVPETTYTVEQAFQRTANLFGGLQGEIDTVNGLIPNQATTQNQLADKAFVNSTVATNAANFRGNWATWADVPSTANEYPEDYTGSRTPTNNDYMVVDDASGYIGTYDDSFTFKKTAAGNNNITITYNGADTVITPSVGLVFGIDNTLKITRADNYTTVAANKQIRVNGTVYEANNTIVSFNTWIQDTKIYTTEFSSGEGAYTGSWRFIFVGDWTIGGKANWQPAYRIGTAFTAAQQAAIDSGITPTMVDNYVDPNSVASTAYNPRITALETDKVDKIYTANKIYGTDSIGAQIGYVAGDNLELSNGRINVVGVQQQIFVMPEATADKVGQIVQYMGETNATYTHGVMYQCVPVYGNYTATYSGTGTLNNLQFDSAVFMRSSEFVEGQTRYVFTCTRAGLRQQWRIPSGMITSFMAEFGISYSGRAAVNDTITITASIVGYTWEAYAGVSSGNDKIDIIGDKIYGVNIVPQYNRNTLPAPTESNVGLICQYKRTGFLLDEYIDGYFYQVAEDTRMREYRLEADPNKYSSLYVDNWFALEDFMQNEFDDVTFYWGSTMSGTGWLMRDSMIDIPTADLSQYGILYTLADGQTLTDGDEITIHIMKSYYWKNIQVQPDDFIVDILPNASEDNYGRIVFLAGSNELVPLEGYPIGKWYRCEEIYDEDTQEWNYEWVLLPNQISLPMVTEMETNASKVITGQCFDYVGDDSVEYSNDLQRIVLRKGHVYRAVVKYPDDPDFATVCYYDAYPYQFDAMPTGEEEYNEVVAQYTGTDESTYVQGHFYRCVPTGNLTAPSSMSRPSEEGFSFEIDASVLETQVDDPSEPFTFEFQSQGAGFQWLVRTGPNMWTTCELSSYGITVVGEAPYGAQVKVKYVEPQPEYEWQEITVGGATVTYDSNTEEITIS